MSLRNHGGQGQNRTADTRIFNTRHQSRRPAYTFKKTNKFSDAQSYHTRKTEPSLLDVSRIDFPKLNIFNEFLADGERTRPT
jgi:hypothetical protein